MECKLRLYDQNLSNCLLVPKHTSGHNGDLKQRVSQPLTQEDIQIVTIFWISINHYNIRALGKLFPNRRLILLPQYNVFFVLLMCLTFNTPWIGHFLMCQSQSNCISLGALWFNLTWSNAPGRTAQTLTHGLLVLLRIPINWINLPSASALPQLKWNSCNTYIL